MQPCLQAISQHVGVLSYHTLYQILAHESLERKSHAHETKPLIAVDCPPFDLILFRLPDLVVSTRWIHNDYPFGHTIYPMGYQCFFPLILTWMHTLGGLRTQLSGYANPFWSVNLCSCIIRQSVSCSVYNAVRIILHHCLSATSCDMDISVNLRRSRWCNQE